MQARGRRKRVRACHQRRCARNSSSGSGAATLHCDLHSRLCIVDRADTTSHQGVPVCVFVMIITMKATEADGSCSCIELQHQQQRRRRQQQQFHGTCTCRATKVMQVERERESLHNGQSAQLLVSECVCDRRRPSSWLATCCCGRKWRASDTRNAYFRVPFGALKGMRACLTRRRTAVPWLTAQRRRHCTAVAACRWPSCAVVLTHSGSNDLCRLCVC